MLEKIKHLIEAGLVYILFTAFRFLPLDIASAVGGWMARCIGPYLSAQKTAQKNLTTIFADLSKEEKSALVELMWDNLGRVAAEFAHLSKDILRARIRITGKENIPLAGKPAFFFSGHYGNWELLSLVAAQEGMTVTAVYREANNKLVDKIIANIRATRNNMFPKGPKGAVRLVRAIKNNEIIAMLVDQKMNDGIAVPFFGRTAMTAPAIAELALRYDMPIIPACVVRTKGAHFEATIYPPLNIEKTGDQERDVLAIMTSINATLEGWIREHPEQWFWVHKRWPD